MKLVRYFAMYKRHGEWKTHGRIDGYGSIKHLKDDLGGLAHYVEDVILKAVSLSKIEEEEEK